MSRERDRYRAWIAEHETNPDKPLVPAATVVLLRDGAGGLEVLMMRRNSRLSFVGGMWVFPGGRIDPEDYPPDAPDDVYEASRHAAVREAEEEAGLVVAADGLVPYSHWIPPDITPKRFATWFFLAEAPDATVVIDGGEIHDHAWDRPIEVIEKVQAGEVEMVPPTFVTLAELADFSSVAEALQAARDTEPRYYATHIGVTDLGAVAMWEGDAGYDTNDAAAPGPRHRVTMVPGRWRLERSG
ncbi:MAG: NUDIX domain-containing protein [Acidimicrobiales bacterium]|nr:NUDIX domain-containing protein [Acidimicrobiales bacterium]